MISAELAAFLWDGSFALVFCTIGFWAGHRAKNLDWSDGYRCGIADWEQALMSAVKWMPVERREVLVKAVRSRLGGG